MLRIIVSVVLLLALNVLVTSCAFLDPLGLTNVEQEWAILDEDSISKGVIIIFINDSVIWEPGDDAPTLTKQIAQSLNLSIDGASVEPYYFDEFVPPIDMYDSQGNVVGSHYGQSSIYYFYSDLDSGFHNLTLEVTSTSGKIFSRSWSIEIN